MRQDSWEGKGGGLSGGIVDHLDVGQHGVLVDPGLGHEVIERERSTYDRSDD